MDDWMGGEAGPEAPQATRAARLIGPIGPVGPIIWLLALLAACQPACHAAEEAGARPAAAVGDWSQPAGGLRVRLISAKAAYATGEALSLRLEIQNVTKGTIAFAEADLQPQLTLPGAPIYEKGSEYAWQITAEPVGAKIHILWATQVRQRMMPRARFVRPGATHAVEITAPVRMERQDKLLKRLEPLDEPPRPQKATLYFGLGLVDPGEYRIRASFDRARDPAHVAVEGRTVKTQRSKGGGGWAYAVKEEVSPWRADKLDSPPITLRIVEPKEGAGQGDQTP